MAEDGKLNGHWLATNLVKPLGWLFLILFGLHIVLPWMSWWIVAIPLLFLPAAAIVWTLTKLVVALWRLR